MKNRIFFFLFLIIGLKANPQSVTRPIIIETRIHAGMILPFYDALYYLMEDDMYAFDLSLGFPTYGKDYWEKLFKYPRTGIGYSFWNLGNKEVFGTAHALYGYLNLPIYRNENKFSINYQLSLGAAYLPKIFDPSENHLNRAISSHTNIYMRLGIDGRLKLSPRCEMVLEAGATHFSNGKIRSPNYGINAGTLSLGINYLLNSNNVKFQEPEIPEIAEKNIQSVIFSAGSKVYDNLLGKKYFVTSVAYNFERVVSLRRRIGLGADLFYDGSIKEALASEDGTPEDDFKKLLRIGLHASYAIRYKKLLLGIQIGYEVYSKYTILTPVYDKISMQYLFKKNVIGSIAVKSHFGKADCLEYGIGYCW